MPLHKKPAVLVESKSAIDHTIDITESAEEANNADALYVYAHLICHVAYVRVAVWHLARADHYHSSNHSEISACRLATDDLLAAGGICQPHRRYWRVIVFTGMRLLKLYNTHGNGVLFFPLRIFGATYLYVVSKCHDLFLYYVFICLFFTLSVC